MDNTHPSRIAIIGGGWAGCAAAVTLTQLDYPVTLFEAGRTLGGRARQVKIDDRVLDNGQHILLGAYQCTLRLMKEVGIDCNDVLHTLPLQFRYPEHQGLDFFARTLPAPFHLLIALICARGINKAEKWILARFLIYAKTICWRLDRDDTVQNLLSHHHQTDRLIQILWQPLCIAALNTPPERASAQIFLNVLRDSIGGTRSASNMLIPRTDLTHLFPDQAAQTIVRHHGVIHFGTTVRRIAPSTDDPHSWQVETDRSTSRFASVIIATHAYQAAQLLNTLPDHSEWNTARRRTVMQLTHLTYEPITTCYLHYPKQTHLPSPIVTLMDSPENHRWGQFVFDRGYLNAQDAGLFSVVISASRSVLGMDRSILCQHVATQLAHAFRRPELETPQWSTVISEKRATFSCQPNLQRPEHDTGIKGILLAGDYTASEYPATLESAVRSGIRAAKMHIENKHH